MQIEDIDVNKIYTKEETENILNKRGQVSSIIGDSEDAKVMISAIYWMNKQ